MDIREFYKTKQHNQTQQSNHQQNAFNPSNDQSSSRQNNKDFSEYADTINKYKDLSQEQLYSELLNQASNLKSQGKLNTQMLDTISSTLFPMLNDEQKQMLNNLMNQLK